MRIVRFLIQIFTVMFFCLPECAQASIDKDIHQIRISENTIYIRAGILERVIKLNSSNITSEHLRVDGEDILQSPSNEISITFTKAYPNKEPRGVAVINKTSKDHISETDYDYEIKDDKIVEDDPCAVRGKVQWVEPLEICAKSWNKVFDKVKYEINQLCKGVKRLHIRSRSLRSEYLKDISIDIIYEIYDEYPVIRKWIEIANNSPQWLKVDRLIIDDIELGQRYLNQIPLTVEHKKLRSGVVGFGNDDFSRGVIAVSEIPSGTKYISDKGAMGYDSNYFEWVIGPTERFISEPVFYYAFSGLAEKTISASSTPLDRAIEGPYMRFLEKYIGIVANPDDILSPLWCSWNNFGTDINDVVIREVALIAKKMGFKAVQLDAGWQGESNYFRTVPDNKSFPDFKKTCEYIRSLGLELGLWVTDSRSKGTKDLEIVPDGLARWWDDTRPKQGQAMSYTCKWRDYYTNDLIYMHDLYGVTYFKQDLANMAYGDITDGHEARTLKESILRNIRGFFKTQKTIKRLAPQVKLMNTWENYWRRAAPTDVAALKYSDFINLPGHNYLGDGKWSWKERQTGFWEYEPEKMKPELLEGCYFACVRFHQNRGLPMYALEHHAASMVNFDGCMTPEIQDHQICCWLMGSFKVFAGDLRTLTEENVNHYRKRFDMVKELHKKYGILRYYQFSGVPGPTKTDWHWWGKLNDHGNGIVVVIRGEAGKNERLINIPWVRSDRQYKVRLCFTDKELGRFCGKDLRAGVIKLQLPPYGQEIIEISSL